MGTNSKENVGLRIGPKLEDCFLKLGVPSWVENAEIWHGSDATLAPLHYFHTLVPDPTTVNSLGPKFCSEPVGSFYFATSLILNPSVNQLLLAFFHL